MSPQEGQKAGTKTLCGLNYMHAYGPGGLWVVGADKRVQAGT